MFYQEQKEYPGDGKLSVLHGFSIKGEGNTSLS